MILPRAIPASEVRVGKNPHLIVVAERVDLPAWVMHELGLTHEALRREAEPDLAGMKVEGGMK